MFSVIGFLKTIEMKRFFFLKKSDDFVEQDFTNRMAESEYCHYRQLVDLFQKSGTIGRMRDLSDFNDALTRERQLRPVPFWKYQEWHPSSSSSSIWWQWSGSWWSFLRVHSKSTKKGACKGLRSNGATRWKQIFDENLRRIDFKISFYFVTDRPFTVDCCLLQQTGITATRTPSTTRSTTRNPIMCAAIWNTWGTRECALCCSLRSQSLFCCRHTHFLAHRT